MGQYRWTFGKDGKFALWKEETKIFEAHSAAETTDGRRIDTREAKWIAGTGNSASYQAENGLILTQVTEDGDWGQAKCVLSDASGKEISTRSLAPLCMYGGGGVTGPLFDGLFSKMLLVPYDNTMWLRYEAVPLRAGRKSYDFSLLFFEDTKEALLMGATDFTLWKNAIACASRESRQLQAISGVADEGTHDCAPHGAITGKAVESAPFVFAYGPDYRDLLEAYGDYLVKKNPILTWKGGVPFGFNSWAGLAFNLNADNFREAGRLFREELRPGSYHNKGEQFINFDARWMNNITPEDRKAIVKELNDNGQHAGGYDAPFACFLDDIGSVDKEIPEVPGHTYREMLLKDENGRLLEKVDGAYPYDITHPVWKQMEAAKAAYYKELGFDYIKLDFMSHGGAEGKHYDPRVRTGRQALYEGYKYLQELMSEEAMGHPFFISISIAPLFPNGLAHARRFSCDSFGKNEDVEYVLNAQTWGWWESGRLYYFNDPDHICLLKGYFDSRESSFGEARARYTTAVIGGTVMMMSDNYAVPEVMRRVRILACNPEVNRLAASGVAFRPVNCNGTSSCNCFTAVINGCEYKALFNWRNGMQEVAADAETGSEWKDLWTGRIFTAQDGKINWKTDGCDALLLQKLENDF